MHRWSWLGSQESQRRDALAALPTLRQLVRMALCERRATDAVLRQSVQRGADCARLRHRFAGGTLEAFTCGSGLWACVHAPLPSRLPGIAVPAATAGQLHPAALDAGVGDAVVGGSDADGDGGTGSSDDWDSDDSASKVLQGRGLWASQHLVIEADVIRTFGSTCSLMQAGPPCSDGTGVASTQARPAAGAEPQPPQTKLKTPRQRNLARMRQKLIEARMGGAGATAHDDDGDDAAGASGSPEKSSDATQPSVVEQKRAVLQDVLLAYSALDSTVGYCQGMNFVAAVFLHHMPKEVRAAVRAGQSIRDVAHPELVI
jgi:hypothetical protein